MRNEQANVGVNAPRNAGEIAPKTVIGMADELTRMGYRLAPRNPAMRPEHPGSLMIFDPEDTGPDGYCIVGDDAPDLIKEAHAHLTQ